MGHCQLFRIGVKNKKNLENSVVFTFSGALNFLKNSLTIRVIFKGIYFCLEDFFFFEPGVECIHDKVCGYKDTFNAWSLLRFSGKVVVFAVAISHVLGSYVPILGSGLLPAKEIVHLPTISVHVRTLRIQAPLCSSPKASSLPPSPSFGVEL